MDRYFRAVVHELKAPGFWENESLWQSVRAGLPGYRLSNFQPLMPPWVAQEVLFDYLLDRKGAAQWVERQNAQGLIPKCARHAST